MAQNNVQQGRFLVEAAEDLSGKQDLIVELTSSGGRPVVRLPTATGAVPLYLLIEGAALGGNCTVEPLDPSLNIRVKVKGAVAPGDRVCLADPATAADAGKVRTVVTTTNGTYRVFLVAEETAADGGLGLFRPNGVDSVVITGN